MHTSYHCLFMSQRYGQKGSIRIKDHTSQLQSTLPLPQACSDMVAFKLFSCVPGAVLSIAACSVSGRSCTILH